MIVNPAARPGPDPCPRGDDARPRDPVVAFNSPALSSYRTHGLLPRNPSKGADCPIPEGLPVSEHLRLVCPHCHTVNRVLRDRLGPGANCGSCLELASSLLEQARNVRELPLNVLQQAA